MQLFRQLRGILCLFLFVQTAQGQTTTFDNLGRLKTIAVKPSGIDMPTNIMTAVGDRYKEEIRGLLLEKVREAIRILKSSNYKKPLHNLYTRLWSDHAQVVRDYETIAQILETGKYVTPSGNTKLFQEIFNKHLSDKAQLFKWENINSFEGVLLQKDALLSFLTDYYNETLAEIAPAYLKKEDIIEASYYLLNSHSLVSSIFRNYRSSPTFFRKTFYDSLISFHQDLIDANSIYNKTRQLFALDWFKKWFWVRGGEIRINPLDFSVDTILQKKGIDLLKTTTIVNYEEQMLLEKRLDTIDYYFRSSKPQIAKTNQWINKISLPQSPTYFQFSASGKADFKNDQTQLKKNLYVNEFKQLVIHNIPADRVAGVREDRKAIANRSEFEAGLDGVVTQLSQLAKAYKDLVATPWEAVSSFFVPLRKLDASSISVKSTSGGGNKIQNEAYVKPMVKASYTITLTTYKTITITGDADQDFIKNLNDTLESDGLLISDSEFTDRIKNAFDVTGISFEELKNSGSKQALLIKVLNEYLNYLIIQMKQALENASKDSSSIADLIQLYNTASTPLRTNILEDQNNSSSYYSTVLQTSLIDSTVENIVRPYTILAKTKTDTVYLDKFSYKIGQTKRFTLSAGLAYTLVGYNQSTATAENGTVTITNNNQLYRFIIGLNVYLGKGLYSLDNKLGPLFSRWYFFAGVGLPKALDNIYTGLGRDLYPGLKVTAGYHFARHNSYLIQNNQIVEERLRYKAAGPFVAVTIDPSSLINVLNIFKKQ